jgi:hypothetical protein
MVRPGGISVKITPNSEQTTRISAAQDVIAYSNSQQNSTGLDVRPTRCESVSF